MTWVAGVDGCKGGWVVALRNLNTAQWQLQLCSCFHDVLQIQPEPLITAVDMPIGLLQAGVPGGRVCDQRARRMLGQPRGRSVFSPPSRPALQANTFTAAQQQNQPAGLTMQAFCLFSKLRQIDAAMTQGLQMTVREIHPEVSFCSANNMQPMAANKKSVQGRNQRLQVLGHAYGQGWNQWWNRASVMFARNMIALDDIIDAHIAAWSAERIQLGTALQLPPNPPVDAKGLCMEILH